MQNPVKSSARELAALIRAKKISPVEVVEAHLRRASALHSRLNAFVHLDESAARAQARSAEAAVSRNAPLGPLHGVPLTVKSCIDVAGWNCPAGSALRKDYVPQQDAVLVSRLKSAGAIILGSTNTPEFLMNYETSNSLHGRTSNPWDLSRSSGGSSGGEAAAISSGCSAGGVGSDGGGSIRVPAHFCGICGLKPTPGRIAATGHFPSGSGSFPWIGVVGPMARSVGDLRLLFETLAGPDPGDSCSAPVPLRTISPDELRGLRIGLLDAPSLGQPTEETAAAVHLAARALEAQGFLVEPIQIPALDQAISLWWYFFGPVIEHLLRAPLAAHHSALSPMLLEYLQIAGAEPPVTLDAFLDACTQRDLCRAQILRQMENVPVLLSPVSLAPAFRHGEGAWRPATPASFRESMRHSQWLNLAGLPGLSLPAAFSNDGLPIGVQLIGRPFEEPLLLAVAESLDQSLNAARFPSID